MLKLLRNKIVESINQPIKYIYIRNAFTNMIVKTSHPVSYHAATIIYDF